MKFCVVGLGEIGFSTASYIANKDFKTWGFDISSMAVKKAKNCGLLATENWSSIPHNEIDVYVICVSTGVDRASKPDVSSVWEACSKIASTTDHDLLVSIESTLSVGTCRKIFSNIFNRNAKLVHVPHRFWNQDPVRHGVRQLRVIGGIDQDSLQVGLRIYEKLEIPMHSVSSIELAEMSKIVENSHRFLQIAFAEELRLMCDEHSVEMSELRSACNTKWNTEILEAREGVGGHCLPKDTHYVIDYTKNSSILQTAVAVDKRYKEHLKNIQTSS